MGLNRNVLSCSVCLRLQLVYAVEPLPRELGSAEVAVGGGLRGSSAVSRSSALDDGGRAEVEHLRDERRRARRRRARCPVPKVFTLTETGSATPMA